MKKFIIAIAGATRTVNANEYSVSPKTGEFEATVNGAPAKAWTTSGKGKSSVNNHYVYFKTQDGLFYFKSDASEVLEARKGFAADTIQSEAKVVETSAVTPAEAPKEMAALMTELTKPVGKRSRVAKAAK